jgi:hypothetical protein
VLTVRHRQAGSRSCPTRDVRSGSLDRLRRREEPAATTATVDERDARDDECRAADQGRIDRLVPDEEPEHDPDDRQLVRDERRARRAQRDSKRK